MCACECVSSYSDGDQFPFPVFVSWRPRSSLGPGRAGRQCSRAAGKTAWAGIRSTALKSVLIRWLGLQRGSNYRTIQSSTRDRGWSSPLWLRLQRAKTALPASWWRPEERRPREEGHGGEGLPATSPPSKAQVNKSNTSGRTPQRPAADARM